MGLAHSPKIVTDGLVFALDTGNDKSYKGPVMTNIANQITQIGTGTANGYSFTASTESVSIPTVGTMTAQVNSGFNNYPSVSTNCCPALFLYGSFSVSPSTLYTYGILYKTTSGYSHPNFMYRYEYTAASAYVTEAGVHSTTNRTHLGDGWYWAWGTFTTSATTTQLVTYSFYYNYGTATDKMYVAKTLLVSGDYTKLHPRYWPDVNTSRANTSVLLDLTQKNTMTATSLTYANTGAISFNGSSDYISIGTTGFPFGSSPGTLCAWAKTNTISGSYDWIVSYGTAALGQTRFLGILNNTFLVGGYGTTPDISYTGVPLNTWFNLVGVYDGTNVSMYLNGLLVVSPTAKTWNTVAGNAQIGRQTNGGEYWNGNISQILNYNRALSAAEIQQNFNALRGRYGI